MSNIEICEIYTRRETLLLNLNEQQVANIQEFKRRALDLNEILKKYNRGAISSFLITEDLEKKKASFKASTPDENLIELLSLKFRFFFAENEKTNYTKFINSIIHNTDDKLAKSYLKLLKNQYNSEMTSTCVSEDFGSPTTNRDMLNLWFNSEIFHSDFDKRRKLKDINTAISRNVSIYQLFVAIKSLNSSIRRLYRVLHKFNEEQFIICTPEHDFTSFGKRRKNKQIIR